MPAKYATQPLWRQRKHALNKRAGMEAEFMVEAEDLAPIQSKSQIMGSPTSVSSLSFDFMPEMKPIVLPGAWVVVDKRGKPLKADPKMYDEPEKKKKRKKKRSRTHTMELVDETLIGMLADAPSTSSAIQSYERCAVGHEKFVTRKLAAKEWARYRREKEIKQVAHMTLLVTVDGLDDDFSMPATPSIAMKHVAKLTTHRDPRANSRAEKTRRAARRGAAAERCWWPEKEDFGWPFEPAAPPAAQTEPSSRVWAKRAQSKSPQPDEASKETNPWFSDFRTVTSEVFKGAKSTTKASKKGVGKQAASQYLAKQCLLM